MFNNLKELELYGFEGFKRIHFLKNNYSVIPEKAGVYIVINKDYDKSFLDESVGGHFKGKNPTISIEKINNNWVENTLVVYIGKAGGYNSKATLKKRLIQYLRFGGGEPVGHWGGRLIWQLKKNNDLIIAWKKLYNKEPRSEEQNLINQFEQKYNRLPFANLMR